MIRRSTWIVLVVFAALSALVIYLQKRPAPEASQLTPTPEKSLVFGLDVNLVTGLRIIGPDGRAFYATRTSDGNWTLVEPANPNPIDSAKVESNLQQLLALQTLSRLEAPPALEAVGLVAPAHIVEIQLSDGSRHRLEVGNQTATASGYYVRVDNTELLVANKFTLDPILAMVKTTPLMPTPTPEPSQTPTEPVATDTPGNSEYKPATPTP